jgi:hypothetical protein
MMAALEAVARPKANAAPRAIVRIIDCFLIFPGYPPRFADSGKPARREPSIEDTEDNDRMSHPSHLAGEAMVHCKTTTQ